MVKHFFLALVWASTLLCQLSLVAEQTLLNKKLKNNTPVTIVKLDAQDKDAFAQAKEVFLRSFEDAYKFYTPEQLYLADKPGFLPTFLEAAFEDEEQDFNNQKKDAIFVVAKDSKNKVIGFVAYDLPQKDNENVVYIRQLAIDPAYKNQGLGKALCVDTIKHIAQYKPTTVTVCTRKINEPAINFYRKLSFKDATMAEVHPELPEYKYCGFALTMN